MRPLFSIAAAVLLLASAAAAEGLTVRGRVVGEDEEPIGSARAELARNAINRGGSGPYRAIADMDGRFEITGLPDGWFDLTVVADGYLRSVRRGFELKNTGEPVDLGTVVLHHGRTLAGRVTGPDGKPLGDVPIQVTEALFTHDKPLTAVPRSVTDEEGRFVLRGVPEPDLTILLDVCVPGRELLRFSLRDLAEPIEIAVPEEGRLAGLVVGPDGKPFAGASVKVVEDMASLAPSPCSSGGPRELVTDAEGRFALEHLSPGGYRFAASAKGYNSGLGSWRVEPGPGDGGPTLRLLRELPPELTSLEEESLPEGCRIVGPVEVPDEEKVDLSGRIVGVAPEDLADTKVYAWSAGKGYANGVVRWDGTYRIPSLAPGEWEVRAYVRSSRHTVRRTVIAAGEEPKLDVVFSPEIR